MAEIISIKAVLRDLNASLTSTLEATRKLDNSVNPPEGGLSLLNNKSELLLSYIQNLVFLVLLKIRNAKSQKKSKKDGISISAVVEKLVELRLYLEKGVRPLEEKLRFQIEKALRAAEDAERSAKAAATSKKHTPSSDFESGSGSDSDSDEDSSSDSDDNAAREKKTPRPSLSNFGKSDLGKGKGGNSVVGDPSLPYRPPKNHPVVMPSERKERAQAREQERGGYKSRTIDEFVDSEVLHNPLEMPSIGSTIVGRGRSMKTARQRAEEDEQREYEESNLVRLPKLSKGELKKKNKAEMRRAQMNFGGEEWRDLDQGIRRIETLTRQKSGAKGVKGALDRSMKRGRDTIDGPRGSGSSGIEAGERFQKKLRTVEAGRRDRGKGKKR
ncbi:hypothetical protein MKZ38_006291 [Zalerion maritima]|uniref:Uncharacterized protein n=1 Tax=Zalerion maritima TaxID=339359 RepID=A0AAD5WPT8_9PEZI|nr:hypothetical protein MKZ38_006291 [Zalerion maritima]